jgi:hypothetical protein
MNILYIIGIILEFVMILKNRNRINLLILIFHQVSLILFFGFSLTIGYYLFLILIFSSLLIDIIKLNKNSNIKLLQIIIFYISVCLLQVYFLSDYILNYIFIFTMLIISVLVPLIDFAMNKNNLSDYSKSIAILIFQSLFIIRFLLQI